MPGACARLHIIMLSNLPEVYTVLGSIMVQWFREAQQPTCSCTRMTTGIFAHHTVQVHARIRVCEYFNIGTFTFLSDMLDNGTDFSLSDTLDNGTFLLFLRVGTFFLLSDILDQIFSLFFLPDCTSIHE